MLEGNTTLIGVFRGLTTIFPAQVNKTHKWQKWLRGQRVNIDEGSLCLDLLTLPTASSSLNVFDYVYCLHIYVLHIYTFFPFHPHCHSSGASPWCGAPPEAVEQNLSHDRPNVRKLCRICPQLSDTSASSFSPLLPAPVSKDIRLKYTLIAQAEWKRSIHHPPN